jgi:hypothetical protein
MMNWQMSTAAGRQFSGDLLIPNGTYNGKDACLDLLGDGLQNPARFEFSTGYAKGEIIGVPIQAAGGIIPITVAGVNVHNAFNVDADEMVNTGDGPTRSPYTFEATSTYNRIIDIPIIVGGAANNMTQYVLQAEIGRAPQKIKVPTTFRWCREYKSISDAYPGFKNWVAGGEFWNEGCNQSLIY